MSSTSTISTSVVQQIIDVLKMHHHHDSTKATYYTVWKKFNQFFVQLDEKPKTWEERLVLFVGYLVQKGLKGNTINSYISAVKAVLRQDGVTLCEDRYLLNSLIKASWFLNNQVRTRLPIQKCLCGFLINSTEDFFQGKNQPYLAALYTSMFAAAYYGMLRIGELTSGLYSHAVKVCDVHLADNKHKILFVLCTSKTHWTDSKPQLIKLTSSPLPGHTIHLHSKDHFSFAPISYCPDTLTCKQAT